VLCGVLKSSYYPSRIFLPVLCCVELKHFYCCLNAYTYISLLGLELELWSGVFVTCVGEPVNKIYIYSSSVVIV